jgi:hypothetical protein
MWNIYLALGMFIWLFILMGFAAYEAVKHEVSERRNGK